MEQEKIIELIKLHCKPSCRVCDVSSYGLKCLFELIAGCYISNDEFKAAMLAAGFEPTPESKGSTNHLYNVEIVRKDRKP